jgi:hypothetical protein
MHACVGGTSARAKIPPPTMKFRGECSVNRISSPTKNGAVAGLLEVVQPDDLVRPEFGTSSVGGSLGKADRSWPLSDSLNPSAPASGAPVRSPPARYRGFCTAP